MPREQAQAAKTARPKVPMAREGGLIRSSDEAGVILVERRGWVTEVGSAHRLRDESVLIPAAVARVVGPGMAVCVTAAPSSSTPPELAESHLFVRGPDLPLEPRLKVIIYLMSGSFDLVLST